MEVSELPKAVLTLALIGMILGVGLVVLNKFDRASRDTATVVSAAYNLSAAGSKDFSQTYCLDIVSIANSSGVTFSTATYNAVWTSADTCVMSYDAIASCGGGAAGVAGQYCNITYTYGADNSGAGATSANVVSALAPIASSWLPLIVTVAVLSIILIMVLGSFGVGKRE
jgi:hypothetical protein